MHKEKDGFLVEGIAPETLPTLVEGYYDDRTDSRWSHPELIGGYTLYADQRVCDQTARINNPNLTREQRIQEKTDAYGALSAAPLPENEQIQRASYTVKGLNEGDEDIIVYIAKPANTKRRKLPVLFGIGQGGFVQNYYSGMAEMWEHFVTDLDVALVFATGRTGIEAAYPAPLDDYQAVYQWLLENAKELRINPDNVVLFGESGGGYTALCFAFRCKRLGLKPKGCLVREPITDDRLHYPSSRIVQGGWDAADVHRTFMTACGEANAFSPFLGPEVVPNHATVEDCKGLCPVFLHALELDADRDASMDFARKLYEAKVYTQIHVWGGAAHGAFLVPTPEPSRICEAYEMMCLTELHDLFKYDFRRDWVNE